MEKSQVSLFKALLRQQPFSLSLSLSLLSLVAPILLAQSEKLGKIIIIIKIISDIHVHGGKAGRKGLELAPHSLQAGLSPED